MTEFNEDTIAEMNEPSPAECPVLVGRPHHPTGGGGNRSWWPDQLNLTILRKYPPAANPMG